MLYWYTRMLITLLACGLAQPMVTARPYTDLGQTTESENVGSEDLSDNHIVLINSNEVPFYHLVHYFTRETMHHEPQVHDLNIAYFLYYTHMYFAWMQVEPNLSVVAVEQGSNNSQLYGANMALPIPALTTMYAPGNITKVLAFVRECYDHVREVNHLNKTAHAFVSTLRTSATLEINQKLVAETTKRFREMNEPGAYHLLWEDQTLMDSFLTGLGYTRMRCGGYVEPQSSVCDWSQLGVRPEKARDLCIYLLVKRSS